MRDFKVIFHQLSLPLWEKILSCILTSGNWSMKWEISSAVESKCVTLFINFMISWRLWFIGQTQPGCFWIKARIRTSSGEGCWVSTFDYLQRDAMTNVVSNQKGKKTHPTYKPRSSYVLFPSVGSLKDSSFFFASSLIMALLTSHYSPCLNLQIVECCTSDLFDSAKLVYQHGGLRPWSPGFEVSLK